MLNHWLLLGSYLLPLGAAWLGVLKIRPAVARARVEREMLLVHDQIMDAVLSGQIDRDNPRATDALAFCEFVASKSRDITLSRSIATIQGLHNAGVDMAAESRKRDEVNRDCADMATSSGNLCLEDAERAIDQALAWYMVRGSSLWWLLAPVQIIRRRRRQSSRERERRRNDSALHHHLRLDHLDRTPMPGELATEMREASRGKKQPPSLWVAPNLTSLGGKRNLTAV